MRRHSVIQFGLGIGLLTILWLSINFSPLNLVSAANNNKRLATMATQSAPSSFDKAPVLTPDQALTDILDANTALHSYKFSAKAGEQYRVSVAVKSGNLVTSLSVVSTDLIQVLGESDGAALIDSTLHFAIPTDSTYGVIVSYIGIGATPGTPAPGTYTITLTRVTPLN
jgi:hypothetical protein